MRIHFVDLKKQYDSIKKEIDIGIQRVLDNSSFILGPETERFEQHFAQYCEAKYAVGVNSGTSALHLALLALGVGQGDEVITVANTYVATVEAIVYCGARPVLIDICPDTYNIDPERIESAVTSKTKAIIPVHLFGQPAEMDPILELAQNKGLCVVEDAAQAHGARYKGKRVGGFGHCACFSFYPGKNLGAYGEGGAVVTNDEDIAHTIRMLRDHGQVKKYYHQVVGYNMRLEGIQAAVLDVKLRHLDHWNAARRKHAERYSELLRELEVTTPRSLSHVEHVYHLYVIRAKDRDTLQEHLNERGIATGLHYPIPIHLQEGYAFLGYAKGDFPVSEQYAQEILSLPLFPELTEEEMQEIYQTIKGFYHD